MRAHHIYAAALAGFTTLALAQVDTITQPCTIKGPSVALGGAGYMTEAPVAAAIDESTASTQTVAVATPSRGYMTKYARRNFTPFAYGEVSTPSGDDLNVSARPVTTAMGAGPAPVRAVKTPRTPRWAPNDGCR